MPRDLPISFKPPLVRAILDGRKTQTRRVVSFEGVHRVGKFVPVATDKLGRRVYEMRSASGLNHIARPIGNGFVEMHFWPRYAVGDRLWVREQWRTAFAFENVSPRDLPRTASIAYVADATSTVLSGRFRAGMHLPRWGSRVTLLVEEVRVERLQDISEADAIAEGVRRHPSGAPGFADLYPELERPGAPYDYGAPMGLLNARGSFRVLWNTINGPGSWEANPWVAAFSFRPILKNIDDVTKGDL